MWLGQFFKNVNNCTFNGVNLSDSNIKYINVYEKNTTNIGDLSCAPSMYFEDLNKFGVSIGVMDLNESISVRNKIFIVGGGGLFQKYFNEKIDNLMRLSKYNTIIFWGCGLDNRIGDSFIYPCLRKNIIFGVRDFGTVGCFVPCASCMSKLFDRYRDGKIIDNFRVYLHSDYSNKIRDDLKNFSTMENKSVSSLNETLEFLGGGEYIITNSYHGIYWSILLNKKVIVLPWVDEERKLIGFPYKFTSMKYDVVLCKNWKNFENYTSCAKNYPDALFECRELNLKFYNEYIDKSYAKGMKTKKW